MRGKECAPAGCTWSDHTLDDQTECGLTQSRASTGACRSARCSAWCTRGQSIGSACAAQVREACSILDIDIEFFPCPKDGPTWRAQVPQAPERTCGIVFVCKRHFQLIGNVFEVERCCDASAEPVCNLHMVPDPAQLLGRKPAGQQAAIMHPWTCHETV